MAMDENYGRDDRNHPVAAVFGNELHPASNPCIKASRNIILGESEESAYFLPTLNRNKNYKQY